MQVGEMLFPEAQIYHHGPSARGQWNPSLWKSAIIKYHMHTYTYAWDLSSSGVSAAIRAFIHYLSTVHASSDSNLSGFGTWKYDIGAYPDLDRRCWLS